jgi:8-oxo-dGTP diphosphatase
MPHGIVVIKRANEARGWALPGGCVDEGAREETSLDIDLVEQFGVYSDPTRIPATTRCRSCLSRKPHGVPVAANDAADVIVLPLSALPSPLWFDHARIVSDYGRYRQTGERPRLVGRSSVTCSACSPAETIVVVTDTARALARELLSPHVPGLASPIIQLMRPAGGRLASPRRASCVRVRVEPSPRCAPSDIGPRHPRRVSLRSVRPALLARGSSRGGSPRALGGARTGAIAAGWGRLCGTSARASAVTVEQGVRVARPKAWARGSGARPSSAGESSRPGCSGIQ